MQSFARIAVFLKFAAVPFGAAAFENSVSYPVL
jgi:hypothetical protein